jgi:hypothetical protein
MMSGRSIAVAASLLAVLSGPAGATHVEPSQAKKAQFTLVNGFEPCDPLSANTATQSGNMPACAPAVPTFTTGCAMFPTGSGKLSVALTGDPTKGNEDLKLTASVKGLNALCENEQMCVSLSFRATTDDCPEGSCTTEDIQNFVVEGAPPTCCTVTGGSCKIKTSLLTALPGTFALNKTTGIQILGCGLQAEPPLAPRTPELSCGVLLK